ncbi:hypothetical protein HDC37_000327 [Microbacterium sp. AK009]|uniref:hypothetical protein n=1 Tax=Microbacterium sp. AK009 TaxID=2723068 RepID=UPI0015CA90A9|nr:hypothetical protein [Microbacterium sp. AK009]NYF15515.1 hypothetical protein [Microbacterium sp. AK009]
MQTSISTRPRRRALTLGATVLAVLLAGTGATVAHAAPQLGEAEVRLTSEPQQTVGANGEYELEFSYELVSGVEQSIISVYLLSGDEYIGLGYPEYYTVSGPGTIERSATLPPGTYTRYIRGGVVCGGDCLGLDDLVEPFTFVVAPAAPQPSPSPTTTTTPTPTPTPTASSPEPSESATPSPSTSASPVDSAGAGGNLPTPRPSATALAATGPSGATPGVLIGVIALTGGLVLAATQMSRRHRRP